MAKLKFQITSTENFWSGMLFIGFGITALVLSRNFSIGTVMNMGPGYFPTVLGILLIFLGAIITITAFRISGEGIGAFAWRPMFLISLAFILFGWSIERLGFVPAVFTLIFLSATAGTEFKWKQILVMSTVLTIAAWALFLLALELPFQPFWWR